MDSLNPANAYRALQDFLNTGGPVLLAIMLAAFVLWSFILERFAYYGMHHKASLRRLQREWDERADKGSWRAHAIRDELISRVKSNTTTNVPIIKTLVAIAPLLGLLGTVYGMITVFDSMALAGSSNARLMAEGVFRATIPTMAGMVVAISGLFFATYFERRARRETAAFDDDLGFREPGEDVVVVRT